MKQNDLLLILIPAFFLIVAWVIFSVYQSAVTSTISQNVANNINPIPPTFDIAEISRLKQRVAVAPQYTAEQLQQQQPAAGGVATAAANTVPQFQIIISTQSAQNATQTGVLK